MLLCFANSAGIATLLDASCLAAKFRKDFINSYFPRLSNLFFNFVETGRIRPFVRWQFCKLFFKRPYSSLTHLFGKRLHDRV